MKRPQMSRRHFLNTSAALPLSLAGHKALSQSNHDLTADCIVLGAGFAGLTAARFLTQSANPDGSLRRVLLLEGSNRIGGRVQTMHDADINGFSSGHPLELGAEYIHRDPGDVPLWNEIHRYQMTKQVDRINKFSKSRVYDADKNKTRKPVMSAVNWGLFKAITMYEKMDDYFGKRDGFGQVYPDTSLSQWVKQYPTQEGQDFVTMSVAGHLPGPTDEISMHGFKVDGLSQQLKEKHEYHLPGGYTQIAQHMANEINNHHRGHQGHILYGQKVTSIIKTANGVTVITEEGRQFNAKTVICTFSIGMLKSGKVRFIDDLNPGREDGLHPATSQAIQSLGAGHHSKVCLRFTEAFWKKNIGFAHIPSRTRLAGKTYFMPYHGVAGAQPPVLTALTLGDDAKRMDNMSDSELVQCICSDLDKIFPTQQRKIESLQRMIRKQWMHDEFAKGGNSYIRIGQQMRPAHVRSSLARADLNAPLFFAGEATAVETQPGSVHGAHASGMRAALQADHFLRGKGALPLANSNERIQRSIIHRPIYFSPF